jgi:hypothetical protein
MRLMRGARKRASTYAAWLLGKEYEAVAGAAKDRVHSFGQAILARSLLVAKLL